MRSIPLVGLMAVATIDLRCQCSSGWSWPRTATATRMTAPIATFVSARRKSRACDDAVMVGGVAEGVSIPGAASAGKAVTANDVGATPEPTTRVS